MKNISEVQGCCGCNACGDACAKKAISFSANEEGFLYPHIDSSQCVNCGACVRSCPVLHVDEVRGAMGKREPTVCAAISKDLEVRFDSTSGGVYSVLAQKAFDDGGFVGGAIWGDDFRIFQIVTNDAADLPKLRSSKYAQSDAQGFYRAIKTAVESGKPVLVCGTPCQMAAVRTFLGRDYSNLLIVDFICRGINSPLVMRKYIEMYERKQGARVVAIKQKSKELGWHRLTTKFTFADGSVAYDPRETSLFMRGYLQGNAFCRPSCYECRFKELPRFADLTVADCWSAVDSLSGSLNIDLGTSLVLCNTAKGVSYFDSVRGKLDCADVKKEDVLKGNRHLLEPLPRPVVDRGKLFRELRDGKFEDAMSFLNAPSSDRRPFWRRKASVLKHRIGLVLRLLKFRSQLLSLVRINGWRAVVSGRPLLKSKGVCAIDISPSAHLEIEQDTILGATTFKVPTNFESRLQLQEGAVLRSKGYSFGYGCDIEIFENAVLEVGPEGYSNIGLTIICGEHVKFGRGVICGRNVSIRDTNGVHYLNRDGYRVSSPVEIGDHVWLCEGCRIMPGVKIGAGSVVAAGAVVTHDVPPNTLVAGIPAKVVRKNVCWR